MTNFSDTYDVIIVGAGPSGSTLGRKLSQQGLKVLLLDKSIFPRYKVCGGGLTLRAAKQLDIDVSPVIHDKISAMELCCNGQLHHTFTKDTPFIYMVMRDEFDMLLLQAAIDAGVDFRPASHVTKVECGDTEVSVQTQSDVYRGRYVVGADGVNSPTAKHLGLMTNKEKILALEYEMKVDDALLERFRGTVAIDYGFIDEGYAWVFPKRDHLSVGIGLGTRDGRFLQEKLMEYLAREQIHGEFLSEKGFFLSVGGSDNTIARGRAALIGDAAGLVDPLMGEGIFYALRSANILADVLLQAARDNEDHPFGEYQRRIEQEILLEMRLFRRASKIFHVMPKQIHKVFIAHPGIVHHAFRVIAGESSFQDFYNKYRSSNFMTKAISGLAVRMMGKA